MSYDHREKAGNRGDLIKHFALFHAIHDYAFKTERFNYLDIHCGRADYTLKKNAAWMRGVGDFVRCYSTSRHHNDRFELFYQLLDLENIATHLHYLGSSKIVSLALANRGITNTGLHLCDTDTKVCASLEKSYAGQDHVYIYCEDGYRKAKQLSDIDLLFIDPPDMQAQFPAYLDLLEHCLHHGQPFIAWNALYGNVHGDAMSERCRTIEHLAERHTTPHITVRWRADWPARMCGCQMLFALQGGRQRVADCQQLAALMKWIPRP